MMHQPLLPAEITLVSVILLRIKIRVVVSQLLWSLVSVHSHSKFQPLQHNRKESLKSHTVNHVTSELIGTYSVAYACSTRVARRERLNLIQTS